MVDWIVESLVKSNVRVKHEILTEAMWFAIARLKAAHATNHLAVYLVDRRPVASHCQCFGDG